MEEKALTAVTPRWLPRTGFDSRAAWDGMLVGERVHIIAAAYRGTPVYFRIVAPWMSVEPAQESQAPARQQIPEVIFGAFAYLILPGALLLARRNVRQGRGDRNGAARIAITVLIASVAEWIVLARHVADAAEIANFAAGFAQALYAAAYVYLAYLALEPYVRRRWPDMLISWTRVLAGSFADPRAGRDLLAGSLAGVLINVADILIVVALMHWFHASKPSPPGFITEATRSWAGACGIVTQCLYVAVVYPLGGPVVLVLSRFVARRPWLTILL